EEVSMAGSSSTSVPGIPKERPGYFHINRVVDQAVQVVGLDYDGRAKFRAALIAVRPVQKDDHAAIHGDFLRYCSYTSMSGSSSQPLFIGFKLACTCS